jgi:hypothetical protein
VELGPAGEANESIRGLVDAWCERRELKALSMILPDWLGNGGMTDQWADLMDALDRLSQRKLLPPDEQTEVERVHGIVRRIVYRR